MWPCPFNSRNGTCSGLKRYLTFCSIYQLGLQWLTELSLCRFSLPKLSFRSVRAGLPQHSFDSPKSQGRWKICGTLLSSIILCYTVACLRLQPAHTRPAVECRSHQISCERLLHIWSMAPVTCQQVMLWAACCLGYFGTFLSMSSHVWQPVFIGCSSDIAVDDRENSFITVRLRRSKTVPVR